MKEYIDREKLIKRLHNAEENYKADHDYEVDDDSFSDGILSAMFSVNQIIGTEPTANVIPIPEGATNGDVIKSIYCQYGLVIRFRPRGEVVVDMTKLQNNGMIPNMEFDEDWWNAPYKKEVEE